MGAGRPGDSALGIAGTILLNAPVALGAYWTARHALRLPSGAARFLGAIVLGWCWITLGLTALGAAGWLRLGPLAVWAGAGFAAGLGFRVMRPEAPSDPQHPGRPWPWFATAALGLVLVPCVALGTTSLLGPVKVVSDGPIYHLYFAVRWWKAGRLELVPVPFGENAATYFPAVGELWFTWLLVGWGGDELAKVGQVPFLVVAAAAGYAMARRLGAAPDGAALAVGWFATSTPLLLFTFEPNVDTIFVAGYLAACFFFLRAALGEQPLVSLALGAIAAGGAWGTKPTGTVFVPPLLAVAGWAAVLRARRGIGTLALMAGLALLMPGYWFARNVGLAGNPLYPLDVPQLGWVGWYGPEVMRQGPYYLPRGDLQAFGDILLAVLDPRLAPGWLAAVLGAWAIGRRKEKEHDFAVGTAALLAVGNVALYWLLIPYRTQQRFFLQALGLAAIPLARLLGSSAVLRLIGLGLLAAHVFTPQNWPFAAGTEPPPWDLSELIPNAVPPPLPLSAGLPALAGLTAACLATAAGWVVLLRRPNLGTAALAAGLLAATASGWAWTAWPPRWDYPTGRFYPLYPDFLRGWMALERAAGPRGARVAYAGTNIPYYLFGTGLRNDVRYVNVDEHRDWLLHDYHRQAVRSGHPHWPSYPRPGWDRARPDYAAWLANLRAAGVDYLVVTRVNPAEGPHNLADPQGFPIERVWADAHPEAFRPMYGEREGDPWFRLYRVLPAEPTEGRPGA